MRILLVAHGFPPRSSGGTEIYTHDLAMALAANPADEVFVLTRESDPARPEYAVRVETVGRVQVFSINNSFRACRTFEDSYRNPDLLAVALSVIERIGPQVAHVQHLTCLSTGLPHALALRSVPIALTLNDYWLLCHRGQLLDLDLRRCNGPGRDGCSRCIPASAATSSNAVRLGKALRDLPLPGVSKVVGAAVRVADRMGTDRSAQALSVARLQHMREAVRDITLFLAPSQTMANAFATFGIGAGRLRLWEQGIRSVTPLPHDKPSVGVLRLLFAGSLLPSKAPHLLIEAAAQLRDGSVLVDVAGAKAAYHGDDCYASQLTPLLQLPFVRAYGSLPPDRLRELMAGADALVVPSVWIENAPFVIKEAKAARLPVVTANLGGMAELVTHDVNGLLFEPGDSASLATQLRRLQNEAGLLDRLRDGAAAPRTIDDEAGELRAIYSGLVRAQAAAGAASAASHLAGAQLTVVVVDYATPEQTWLAVRSIKSSLHRVQTVLVVDNGAPAESAFDLRERLREGRAESVTETGEEHGAGELETRVLAAGRNLGFSGGVNLGIVAAMDEGAEFVLLVNSDAVLAPDAIGHLLDAAAARPAAGVFAPLIVSREEPDWIVSAGIDYSKTTGRMRNLLTSQPLADAPSSPFAVTAVSGCVMLIRRSVFEAAGLFDEAYFFSFEDVDFSLRATAAGFQVLCVPEARAWHEGGRSIGRRSPRRIYFATRNHLRLAASLERRRVRRALTAGSVVALNTAYVLTSADAPLWSGLAAVLRGTWHHLLGRYGSDSAA